MFLRDAVQVLGCTVPSAPVSYDSLALRRWSSRTEQDRRAPLEIHSVTLLGPDELRSTHRLSIGRPVSSSRDTGKPVRNTSHLLRPRLLLAPLKHSQSDFEGSIEPSIKQRIETLSDRLLLRSASLAISDEDSASETDRSTGDDRRRRKRRMFR